MLFRNLSRRVVVVGRVAPLTALSVLVLLALLVAQTNANAQPRPASPSVLVVVNGDAITSRDLDGELISSHRGMNQSRRRDFDYRSLLTKLVNDRLLVQEAEAIGIRDEPALRASYDSKRNIHAASLWVKDNYHAETNFDEAEVRKYYGLNFSQVRMRTITLQTADSAETILSALRAGADMDSLARLVSIDSYASKGGLRPVAYRKDLDPLQRALTDTITVSTISSVIPFHSVFAVLRLEERMPEDPEEFATMRPGIETWLRKREGGKHWDNFLGNLKKRVGFSVDYSALAAIRADSARLFTQGFTQGTDSVVIRVTGETALTDSDLRRKISHLVMSARDDSFDALFERAQRELTEEIVLTAMARTAGYHDRLEVVTAFERALDSVAIETYLAETVVPRITFKREEFEDYYNDHIDEFQRVNMAQFDRIVVDSETVAMQIYDRIREGADFGYVARQYGATVAPPEESAEWIPVNVFPDIIRQELEALSVGGCMTPRLMEEGWLILKLRSRQDGGTMSLAEVEPTVRTAIFQQKFKKELDGVLDLLKSGSVIEYDEAAIEEYFKDGS